MTRENFVALIAPLIVEECKKRGYSTPSAIIAQACVESANGNSELSSRYHNYWGLKCGSAWTGKSVNMRTREEYSGNSVYISDNFRAYDNMKAGVSGYFDFISTPRYSNLKSAKNSREYLEMIKADGFATSSTYVSTVAIVLNSAGIPYYDLYMLDGAKTEEKPSKSKKKSVATLAKEVIAGEWGNGEYRREALTEAGYNYEKVQKKVNEMLSKQG